MQRGVVKSEFAMDINRHSINLECSATRQEACEYYLNR